MREWLCKVPIKKEKGWVYFISFDEEQNLVIGRSCNMKKAKESGESYKYGK